MISGCCWAHPAAGVGDHVQLRQARDLLRFLAGFLQAFNSLKLNVERVAKEDIGMMSYFANYH